VVKCLTGEPTPEEREAASRWIAADPGHKSYADALQTAWKESRRLAPPGRVDASAAWERFVKSGKIPAGGRDGAKRVRIGLPLRAVAAAVLLLGAGAGAWWGLTRDAEVAGLSFTAGAVARTDTLPDGSRVTLNKYSSLVLPAKWGRGSRVARLTGEGFFQVVHEPGRPFTVEAGGVTIRDVGTSFNVRPVNGATEVVVEDGVVLVTDSVQTVRAAAGEKVVIAARHGGIRKTSADDQLYQYYRTKKFVCRKTPLPQLVTALNEAYGAKIVVHGDAVRDLRLTTTFDNDDLDSILSVITRTFGLVAERNGDLIILKRPDD
jgi:ferric-dicitrate binding protein FerR (iron transport regulator)